MTEAQGDDTPLTSEDDPASAAAAAVGAEGAGLNSYIGYQL